MFTFLLIDILLVLFSVEKSNKYELLNPKCSGVY